MPYYNHFNLKIDIPVSKLYELCENNEHYVVLSDSEFKLLQNCNSVRIDTELNLPSNEMFGNHDYCYIICYGYISTKKNIDRQQLLQIAEDSMNKFFLVFGGKPDNYCCIEDILFFDCATQSNKIPIACFIECKIKDSVSKLAFGVYDFLCDCNIIKNLEPDFELHITKQIDYAEKYNSLCFTDENGTNHEIYPGLENLYEIWKRLVSCDEAAKSIVQRRTLI